MYSEYRSYTRASLAASQSSAAAIRPFHHHITRANARRDTSRSDARVTRADSRVLMAGSTEERAEEGERRAAGRCWRKSALT